MPCNNRCAALLGLCIALGVAACASPPPARTPPLSAPAESAPAQRAETPEADAGADTADDDYMHALGAMQEGDGKRAEKHLLAAISARPRWSEPYTNLGILYYRQGRYAEAEAALGNAIDNNPDNYPALNYLGMVYRHNGQFGKARQAYAKALGIKPDYHYAHLNMGILNDLYLGDLDRALVHYQRYLDLEEGGDNRVKAWIFDVQRRIEETTSTEGPR